MTVLELAGAAERVLALAEFRAVAEDMLCPSPAVRRERVRRGRLLWLREVNERRQSKPGWSSDLRWLDENGTSVDDAIESSHLESVREHAL